MASPRRNSLRQALKGKGEPTPMWCVGVVYAHDDVPWHVVCVDTVVRRISVRDKSISLRYDLNVLTAFEPHPRFL